MSKHLLLDLDSTIPNLALMKISAWAKARGDTVILVKYQWNSRDKIISTIDYGGSRYVEPDHIWLSCLFTWHRSYAYEQRSMYSALWPKAEFHIGGTGFDFDLPKGSPEWKVLPPEIENMQPDYDLYYDDRAIGFCQRGCNRKCQFCVVWRKEGRISDNKYVRLTDWVPEDRKKVLLLDNDIAIAERWKHDQVLQDSHDMGLKMSLTQGYDIRTLAYADGPERAQLVADNKPYSTSCREHMLYTAWDDIHNERLIRTGIERLLDAGFKGREITCYILVGFDSTHEQDVYRARTMRNDYGVLSYIMPYNNVVTNQDMLNLRRWANFRQLYRSFDFPDYNRNYRTKKNEAT